MKASQSKSIAFGSNVNKLSNVGHFTAFYNLIQSHQCLNKVLRKTRYCTSKAMFYTTLTQPHLIPQFLKNTVSLDIPDKLSITKLKNTLAPSFSDKLPPYITIFDHIYNNIRSTNNDEPSLIDHHNHLPENGLTVVKYYISL